MADENNNDPFTQPGMPQPGLGDAQQPGMYPPPAPAYSPPTPVSPGGAPSGFPPPAPYGQPTSGSDSKNVLGILAIVAPLLGMAVVGIILGHLGLSAVRKGQANNRSVALAGTILSYIFTAVSVIFVAAILIAAATADTAATEPESTVDWVNEITSEAEVPAVDSETLESSALLVTGDCILDPYVTIENELGSVERVSCDTPHYGEVFYLGTVDAETYPGEEALWDEIDAVCIAEFELFVGIDYYDSELYFDYFYPTNASWKFGDRAYQCMVTPFEGTLDSSMQGSGI